MTTTGWIAAAIVVAVTAALGWAVTAYLRRRTEFARREMKRVAGDSERITDDALRDAQELDMEDAWIEFQRTHSE